MQDKELFAKLASFGHKLLNKPALEEGMHLITDYAKEITGAERSSIFLHDREKKVLWTTLADSIDHIKISDTKGIAGKTLRIAEEIVVNNPYSDPDFLVTIDAQSGFITKNIVSAPIFDSSKKVIGVLQVLNKEDGFNAQDVKFIKFFVHYISTYLELASIYGDH